MSKKFTYTYIALQLIGLLLSIIFIGIGTDYVKAGEYKEWLFVVGCLANCIPLFFAWCVFWLFCIKSCIKKRGEKKMKNVSFSRNGVEFEPTKQELKIVLDDYAKQLGEKDKKIADLEAKLAEKEKEIEELRFKERNIFPLVKNLEQKVDQAKTDFAIEQLEKVKKYIHGKYLDEAWHNKIVDEDREDIHDFIDNQIKELRG